MLRSLAKYLFIIVMQLAVLFANAQEQNKINIREYINTYKDIAIKNMKTHHIPASITLAQGIHESGCGNSDLARIANNHFGIKCHNDWKGPGFYKDDDAKNECFRKYNNAAESFDDHCNFLTTRQRYAFLFDYDLTDYKSWAYGLKQAGYATNPKYPEVIIKTIEDNQLYLFDKNNGDGLARYDTSLQKPVATEVVSPSEQEDFSPVVVGPAQRPVFFNNGVKYIIAKSTDTYKKLADELGMFGSELYRFNDLKKGERMIEGLIIYIEPKRARATTQFHLFKKGETMHSVSQYYGVKLKSLYRKNRMEPGTNPNPGQKLWLRKKKPRG